jgi:SIR2-like domain
MILVIFGAGASYDSCPTFPVRALDTIQARHQTPERPPLAVDLFYNTPIFSNALNEYWECNPIVPYLREISDGLSFEQILDNLQNESSTDPIRKKQLTGMRFYLQEMLYQCEAHWAGRTRGITNYLTLMDQLRRKSKVRGPIILVTFNYDRLLDQALYHCGVYIKNIDDYVSNENVRLFKLHGSINWGREINSLVVPDIGLKSPREVAHDIIDKSPDLNLSSNYVLGDGQFPFVRNNGVPIYPALAIPIVSKQTFECPDKHINELSEILKDTEKVLIVGWRAAEKHFLDLLKSSINRQLTVEAVGGNKDWSAQTLTKLQTEGLKIVGTAFNGGFTEYVKSREAESFFG